MAKDISELLAATRLKGGYVAATPTQAEAAEELFGRLLGGERGGDLDRGLEALGFSMENVSVGGQDATAVREATEAKTGKGLYVVRRVEVPVLLQSPHRYKDLGTGDIVARMFAEQPFTAAAWNTVPRWYDEGGARVDADLAHTEVSFFNAFTRAFAMSFPNARIVQIHGFARDGRKTDAGARAAAIVSSGRREAGPAATAVRNCLATAIDAPVLLYPDMVSELGATTNANAAALRALGAGDFVHLELSEDTRKRLKADRALRGNFGRCLSAGL